MFIRILIYHTVLKFYNYDIYLYLVQSLYTLHNCWENKNEWKTWCAIILRVLILELTTSSLVF